jgi:hypothetical protein
MATDNFDEVFSQLNSYEAKKQDQALQAIQLIARQLYRNAYDNANQVSNPPVRITVKRGKNAGRQYLRYNPHIGGDKTGPNRGTGNLLNSMTFSANRQGFGSYVATYGVGMEYARALEFGSPIWKSGVKYPYVQPALNKLVKGGQISQILAYSFGN